MNNPGTGWQTFTLTSSQALTSGTYYWLMFWSAANYSVQNTTSSGSSWYRSLTYGSLAVLGGQRHHGDAHLEYLRLLSGSTANGDRSHPEYNMGVHCGTAMDAFAREVNPP